MTYSGKLFRSHPFASTRRKMDRIVSQFINPLTEQIFVLETKLSRLTARFEKAFAKNKNSGETTRLDYDRSMLAQKLAARKAKLAHHRAKHDRLQRSMTGPTEIRRKSLVALRRAV
ncbi:MAG: hypothetical protein Q8L64_04465 [bacterium]|nr:hypothetical protein [bacterium]